MTRRLRALVVAVLSGCSPGWHLLEETGPVVDRRDPRRRELLKMGLGLGLVGMAGPAAAQSFEFKGSQRYPDPAVEILDPSFGKYRVYSAGVEQLATGFRWAEGPVWFGDGR
jgi:gluconolactonase